MIGIIGGGAWGQALASTIAGPVTLWRRGDDPALLSMVSLALLAVPAQQVRSVMKLFAPHLPRDCPVVICAKGLEQSSGKTLTTVLREELPSHPLAILSGPTFAAEVAAHLPTACTIAARDETLAATIAARLSGGSFRLYHSTDVTGVEIGGALKNVVAIACGIVIGRGLGDNARAALMTRGLAEITRLALKLGARAETLMGLSALGDLALTCASQQSRNFSFGVRLGQGAVGDAATAGHLVEGRATAGAALLLAEQHGVELPIAAAVTSILSSVCSIDQTIAALMGRPLRTEAIVD